MDSPTASVCVGGYDGTLAGLSLTTEEDSLLSLSATFCYNPHLSAIRSAAIQGNTVATGGDDETIRIYDLSRRIELGTLFKHEGTVNCLTFVRDGPNSLLFSAADDRTICVWRCADWKCFKSLTGHMAGVTDVAIHPSRRLMLSVAKDRAVFMWNLVKGKVVFSAKTKQVAAGMVRWAPDGGRYILAAGRNLTLASVTGKEVSGLEHETDIGAIQCLDDKEVLFGGEDGVVKCWDWREGKHRTVYKHEGRIRDVSVAEGFVISADSRGGVKVWDRRKGEVRLQTSVGGGDMKLTCMATNEEGEVTEEAEEEVQVEPTKDTNNKSGKTQLEGTASQRKRKKRKKKTTTVANLSGPE